MFGAFTVILTSLFAFVFMKKITLDIWSIKVFKSDTFLIKPISRKILGRPTLEASDVTDVHAEFVADPFIIKNNSTFYMFFEVLNKATRKGVISLATSNDGEQWDYKKVILKKEYHLSYPYVFKFNDNFYMIPETNEANGVFLYKSKNFPYDWEVVKKLIDGKYLDPSIFQYNNKWWLLVAKCGGLHLFYSEHLLGEWKEHLKSPIIEGNNIITRPGGRVIINNEEIYRYAQDGEASYGSAVRIIKINKLTELDYEEEEISVVLNGTKREHDWNTEGMHNIDQLKISKNQWLLAVDGHKKQNQRYILFKLEYYLCKFLPLKFIRKSFRN
ncbi:glucosamine inositolphosphorylceramide transferase family protein [Bacillus sp. AFS002410]|uniref:glucosamine inositolphosphorylceramide transferase family protein n=1 Tax=Bacillus sp. AFS002410 TaxID=2033481 RepID=UPI0011556270|nr:family 43 glycosylhydrolase [Bacillus sp. AFS002410]